MKRYIKEMLETYTGRDLSPWHMPGHKRRPVLGGLWDDVFRLDVTEVPGTDDLHRATGPILESEQAAADMVGAAYAHYLVGGSTAGILAAIGATAMLWREDLYRNHAWRPAWMTDSEDTQEPASESDSSSASEDDPTEQLFDWMAPGAAKKEVSFEKIRTELDALTPIFLVGANCHLSVHHGLRLAGAEMIMLRTENDSDYGPISSEELLRVLSEEVKDLRRVAGCIITSPTYGGSLSPLGELHAVLEVYGIRMIVDEAHGAHLPFSSELAGFSGISCGADYVIASLHKTLPALTQTAVLYVGGDRREEPDPNEDYHVSMIDEQGKVMARREICIHSELSVFQSSSPSYILMLSAEEALAWADENREKIDTYVRRMWDFREELREALSALKLVQYGADQDPSRMVLTVAPEFFAGWQAVIEESRNLADRLKGGYDKEAYDRYFEQNHIMESCCRGTQMARWLEQETGIVVELAGFSEMILISTVCDEESDLQRLKESLISLDRWIMEKRDTECAAIQRQIESVRAELEARETELLSEKTKFCEDKRKSVGIGNEKKRRRRRKRESASGMEVRKRREPNADVEERPESNVEQERVTGPAPGIGSPRLPKVGDFVQRDIYVYPPGVPIVRAGQRVTEEALRRLQEEQAAGRRIYGL
ncbi:MAG: hypothetical protein K5897_06750 [Eubacterium sp.]|nr:hypothetical protein [Eubacterium sp.]